MSARIETETGEAGSGTLVLVRRSEAEERRFGERRQRRHVCGNEHPRK